MDPRDREPLALMWLVLCAASAIRPFDRGVWLVEVLALAPLITTHRRFRFTPLVYR